MDYHGKISERKDQDYSEIYFVIPNNYLSIFVFSFSSFCSSHGLIAEAYFHYDNEQITENNWKMCKECKVHLFTVCQVLSVG